MYYTYILFNSITNRYYIGYTPDLRSRLKTHLSGSVKSTKSDLHYQLAWYCAFPDRSQATSFEKYLKSGSGIAFMKKRFLKSANVVLEKDTASKWDGPLLEAFLCEVENPTGGTLFHK